MFSTLTSFGDCSTLLSLCAAAAIFLKDEQYSIGHGNVSVLFLKRNGNGNGTEQNNKKNGIVKQIKNGSKTV